MNFKNTYKEFNKISKLIIKGLRQQLLLQEYYSTGKLSRSFTGVQEKISGDNLILNITSSKDYWRVVNDPKVVYGNMKANGKENYIYWQHGNTLTRSNFAGIVAKEKSNQIGQELAQSIGEDVADMIREEIKKFKPTAQIS